MCGNYYIGIISGLYRGYYETIFDILKLKKQKKRLPKQTLIANSLIRSTNFHAEGVKGLIAAKDEELIIPYNLIGNW